MEGPTLVTRTDRYDVMLIPRQRDADSARTTDLASQRRRYSMREVADMLGYGVTKVKMLVITGELRSIKDGKYRRILPEWVDEYIAERVKEWAA